MIFKDPAIQRSANQQTEKFIQLSISPLPYSISLQHYYSNYQSRRTLTSIQNYSGASNNHRFVNCDIVCSLRFRFSTRIENLREIPHSCPTCNIVWYVQIEIRNNYDKIWKFFKFSVYRTITRLAMINSSLWRKEIWTGFCKRFNVRWDTIYGKNMVEMTTVFFDIIFAVFCAPTCRLYVILND